MNPLPPRRRAVEASRRLLFKQSVCALDYVEAIAIAEPHQRAAYVVNATDALIATANVVDAAEQILAAYFHDLPSYTVDAEPLDEDLSSPVPAPVTGERRPGDGDMREPGTHRDDGRRELSELEAAAEVLTEATLRAVELHEFAQMASKTIRTRVAYKLSIRGAKTAALTVDTFAVKLAKAGKAAGTLVEPMNLHRRPDEELALIDKAIARGAGAHEVEAIARFGTNYDELRAHGHEPSMSRAQFVDTNMRLWKHDNR